MELGQAQLDSPGDSAGLIVQLRCSRDHKDAKQALGQISTALVTVPERSAKRVINDPACELHAAQVPGVRA